MARTPIFNPPPGPQADLGDRLSRVTRKRGRILTLLISVAALASFGGVIYWAHEQDLRSGGEGIVPLIRAEDRPAKVRPEQPGGMVVPDQDKTVYDRISPGSVPTGPEKLLPPPPVPQIPPATPAAPTNDSAAAAPPAPPAAPSPATTPTTQAAAPVAPAPGAVAAPPAPPASQGAGGSEVLMPAGQGAAAPANASAPPSASQSIATLIDSISGIRIQLASVRSEDQAQATWARLKKGNEDVLGPLTMRAVKVDLGERGVFYRVQAGPLDEPGAQSACAKLKSRSVDCIVVKP